MSEGIWNTGDGEAEEVEKGLKQRVYEKPFGNLLSYDPIGRIIGGLVECM